MSKLNVILFCLFNIYFTQFFLFHIPAGHGIGHFVGPKGTWDSLLASERGHWLIGVLAGKNEAIKNDKEALKKRLQLIREEHLRTHTSYHSYNNTRELSFMFDSANNVNLENIARVIPNIERLMNRAINSLSQQEIKMKEKLTEAIKPLMTKYGLSLDLIKNDSDVSRYWDLIGTYLVNSKNKTERHEKFEQAEDEEEEKESDLALPLGLGFGVLALLLVSGAVILFCT